MEPYGGELGWEDVTARRTASTRDAHRFRSGEHGEPGCALQPEEVSQRHKRPDRICRARVGRQQLLGAKRSPSDQVHERTDAEHRADHEQPDESRRPHQHRADSPRHPSQLEPRLEPGEG